MRMARSTACRAPVRNPPLDLPRHVLGHQLRVDVGIGRLLDVDPHFHRGHRVELPAQLVNVLTRAPNHDAGLGRLDSDSGRVRSAVDDDIGDRGIPQLLKNVAPHLHVLDQVLPILVALGEPAALGLSDNAQSETVWMYLLTH
jgi:hypothetical protein